MRPGGPGAYRDQPVSAGLSNANPPDDPPGRWDFTRWMRPDNEKTGDAQSRAGVNYLANPARCADTVKARFRDRHDALFGGGVVGAYPHEARQFNEGCRGSFEGVTWRLARQAGFTPHSVLCWGQ